MTVRVDVLGPLRLLIDGGEVTVPGPKRRALLALLAMAEGRAVAVDDLLDALWRGDLPDTARATLQSHVSRLRRHLGPGAGRLEGFGAGYRLVLAPEETDLGTIRRLLAAAHDVAPGEAARLLDEARSLWRGEPLAEFADVAPLMAAAVTLAELRRTIDESLVDALLRAGERQRAASVAAEHAASNPLSEPAALLHMKAVHAAGRTADALRIGYEYRRRLASETGLDPSAAVRDLEALLASSAAPSPGRVPRSPHPLRGRDSELAALRRLLSSERLVTLVGPGGVGKTRLALEAAAGFEPATAVLLAPVTDPGALPQAIAEALGLRVIHGDVVAACAALLAAGPRLLLVDNCEHLLDSVGRVVGQFVRDCPELMVLATSREPLGLPAEQRLRIAPLAVSRPRDAADLDHAPAVAVFVDRASRFHPTLQLSECDLATVTDIVRRVDGLPLAIELAAGRLSSLGLDDLHARLDQALDLLGDDRRGTLRQTIAWSYDLLGDDEQRLLRFMSAFPDGLDLTTAEALGAELGLASPPLDVLSHLVDASMLETSHGPTTRYRMLDTVAAFMGEQLDQHGEVDEAIQRFLRWALELVSWIEHTTYTTDEHKVDRALRRELPSLRAAWTMLRSRGDLDATVAILRGLLDAATWRDLTDMWEWSLELAAEPDIADHPDGASVLGLAAASAWFRGELHRAEDLANAGLDLADGQEWACLDALSLVALSRGQLDLARERATAAGNTAPRPAQCFGVAALAAAYSGDLGAASLLNERFAAVATCPTLAAFHDYVTAELDSLDAHRYEALARYDKAIDLAQTVGSTFVQGIASVGRLSNLAAAGETQRALLGYRDLIDYWERTGSWIQQWTTLRNLADLLVAIGDAEAACALRVSAEDAPDAPRAPARSGALTPKTATEHTHNRSADRGHALQIARDAIEHALATARCRSWARHASTQASPAPESVSGAPASC